MPTQMTHARFHRLENLTVKQLRTLDRQHTVVLLPIGMVEEHGDHLPLGTDTFAVEAICMAAGSWLLDSYQDVQIVMLPTMPYGVDPIDDHRPDLFTTAGSVWISRTTLKALVVEVLSHMVRFGFKYIFPVGFHGGPDQSVVLDEVCTELRDANPDLVIYEPMGYVMAGAEKEMSPGIATLLGRPLTAKEEVALKTSIHASMFETSVMLHLRPDLVDRNYKNLRTIEWREMFELPDWPGYTGAGPSHSDPDVGGAVLRWRGVRAGSLIHRAMFGEDLTQLLRHPKWMQEPILEAEIPEIVKDAPHNPIIDSNPVVSMDGDKVRERVAEVLGGSQDETRTTHDDDTPPAGVPKTEPKLARPVVPDQNSPLGDSSA